MKRKAKIYYVALDDFWRKEEKLNWLNENPIAKIAFEKIEPDDKHNWINQTDNDFETLLPLIDKDVKLGRIEEAIFELFSLGVVTARDEWVYDFDKDKLSEKINFLIDSYNKDLKVFKGKSKDKIKDELGKRDTREIKWTRAVINDLTKNKKFKFDKIKIVEFEYRPFIKKYLYFDSDLNEMQYQLPQVYGERENVTINFLSVNSSNDLAVLASNKPFDYCYLKMGNGGTQCLPRYNYSENQKRENITDWALEQFQNHYAKQSVPPALAGGLNAPPEKTPSAHADGTDRTNGARITKQDIFYYVYAVLHSPVYRKKYEQNLKREFPRLPFYADFFQWRDWGAELMDLHINYETVEPFTLERNDLDLSAKKKNKTPDLFDDCLKDNDSTASGANPTLNAKNDAVPERDELPALNSSPSAKENSPDTPDGLHPPLSNSSAAPTKNSGDANISDRQSQNASFVAKPQTKLRADKENGTITIDSHTILTGVPAQAWAYKLGNRSAIEWVLDQYKEKTPQDATIRERFDHYKFSDYKEHVIDLLMRVTNVSVKTTEIVNQMPGEQT